VSGFFAYRQKIQERGPWYPNKLGKPVQLRWSFGEWIFCLPAKDPGTGALVPKQVGKACSAALNLAFFTTKTHSKASFCGFW